MIIDKNIFRDTQYFRIIKNKWNYISKESWFKKRLRRHFPKDNNDNINDQIVNTHNKNKRRIKYFLFEITFHINKKKKEFRN